ncbi:hypothetical protein [Lutibacter sp.]|uniref:hypothetical protein n=1 Tax=Lutibacter sp. TaxID=1925666 RepID=UPI0035669894
MKINFRINIIIILFYGFCYNNAFGQHITFKRIESRLITNEGIEFVGDLKDKNSDLYSFPDWNNQGVIFLDSNRYTLSNINFNVSTNTFDSRINRDKLFSFKTNEIDSVLINNLLFKKIGTSFYEVLFENGDNLLLKKHDITFKNGVENRLGVGTLGKTKTLIAYNYLIKSGDLFKRIELNKSSIVSLLENDKEIDELDNFVKDQNLSYKKADDIILIFKFIFKNYNKII